MPARYYASKKLRNVEAGLVTSPNCAFRLIVRAGHDLLSP